MSVVLDSSALIALIWGEPGGDKVNPRVDGALISAVNLTEVGDYFLRHGGSLSGLDKALRELPIKVVPAETEAALAASDLYILTRAAGLSLGDRFCLALGRRLGRPVLTADRAWGRIADAVGVRVELIR